MSTTTTYWDDTERAAELFFTRKCVPYPKKPMPQPHWGKSEERLALEWRCYLTLHRAYMQTNDDLVLTVGHGGCWRVPAPYDRVARHW